MMVNSIDGRQLDTMEGNDLYVTVRASYGSAHSCHDANYNLFFHLKDLTL